MGERVEVVDVEFRLPPPGWQGSMTDAIYALPGVIHYSFGPTCFYGGFISWMREMFHWHFSRSGS